MRILVSGHFGMSAFGSHSMTGFSLTPVRPCSNYFVLVIGISRIGICFSCSAKHVEGKCHERANEFEIPFRLCALAGEVFFVSNLLIFVVLLLKI